MSDEFTKTAKNAVVSKEGFSVEVKFAGGVVYREGDEEISIDTEWLVKPAFGMVIYKDSHANKGLEGKDQAQTDAVFDKIIRALQFMGYRIEVDDVSAQPRIFNPLQ
jgi:hypothetical protein